MTEVIKIASIWGEKWWREVKRKRSRHLLVRFLWSSARLGLGARAAGQAAQLQVPEREHGHDGDDDGDGVNAHDDKSKAGQAAQLQVQGHSILNPHGQHNGGGGGDETT